MFIQPLLLQGLFYGRKTCQRHHAEFTDVQITLHDCRMAIVMYMLTSALDGLRRKSAKAIQQSAAMGKLETVCRGARRRAETLLRRGRDQR